MASTDKRILAYMGNNRISNIKIAEKSILREEVENIKSSGKNIISSEINSKEKGNIITELNKIYKKNYLNFIIDKKGNLVLKDNEKVVSNFFIYPKAIINEYDEYNILRRKLYLQICFSTSKKTLYLLIDDEKLENDEWIRIYLKNFKYNFNFRLYNKFKDLVRFSINNKKKLRVIDLYSTTGIVKTFDKKLEFRTKYFVNYNYTQATLIKAYKDILDFIQVASEDITMPILCYTILGSIKSILKICNLEPNFVLVISGEDISEIRSLTYLFSGILHFDEEIPRDKDLRANYTDKIQVIKAKAAKYKDSLLVIDYSEAENIKELEESFLNNYYEIKRYNEMSKDNNTYALNRLPILLYKESLKKPLYYNIKVENNIALKDKMQKFYNEDNIIPDGICNFIDKFISIFNLDKKSMIDKIKCMFKDERKKMSKINYTQEREVEIFSWFMLALKLFIEYGESINAISSDQGNEIIEKQRSIFKNKLLDKQVVKKQNKEDIQVDIFMNSLKYILENKKEMIPKLIVENLLEVSNTKYVGWLKKHPVYYNEKRGSVECIFLNEQSFRNLNNTLHDSKSISIEYENLLKALDKRGIIGAKDKDGRNEKSIKLKGNNYRFLLITLEKLYNYLSTNNYSKVTGVTEVTKVTEEMK